MTQVALITHYIERRVTFDDATDVDDVELKSCSSEWLSDRKAYVGREFLQYDHPAATQFLVNRDSTALGCSYSIEVSDIQAEYVRMSDLGAAF